MRRNPFVDNLRKLYAMCKNDRVDGVVQVGVGFAAELDELLPSLGNLPLFGFEPVPSFIEYWKAHGYPGTLIEQAIGNQPGTATIYSSKVRRESSSMFPRAQGEARSVEVSVTTLDAFLAEYGDKLGSRLLLWIDCEGAELMAIQGGVRLLQRCVLIMCETHELHEMTRPPGLKRVGVPPVSDVEKELALHEFKRLFQVSPTGAAYGRY